VRFYDHLASAMPFLKRSSTKQLGKTDLQGSRGPSPYANLSQE